MNYSFHYVPYPNFSDDKHVYLKVEIICSTHSNGRVLEEKVMGNCSAILVKATPEKKAYFSYFDFYMYNTEEAIEKGFRGCRETDVLAECEGILRAIGG